MSNTLNINNLTLSDNGFILLPDGDYRFRVDSHEVGYSTSDKMPPNTQQIKCSLEIPFEKDGALHFVNVNNNLNVYSKGLWAIRRFTDSIGLTPEEGNATINLEDMDGKEGVCHISSREYNGKEYNQVQHFYAPSKAPAVTDNDEAWKKRGFESVEDDEGWL